MSLLFPKGDLKGGLTIVFFVVVASTAFLLLLSLNSPFMIEIQSSFLPFGFFVSVKRIVDDPASGGTCSLLLMLLMLYLPFCCSLLVISSFLPLKMSMRAFGLGIGDTDGLARFSSVRGTYISSEREGNQREGTKAILCEFNDIKYFGCKDRKRRDRRRMHAKKTRKSKATLFL